MSEEIKTLTKKELLLLKDALQLAIVTTERYLYSCRDENKLHLNNPPYNYEHITKLEVGQTNNKIDSLKKLLNKI